MKPEFAEWTLIDEQDACSLTYLCEVSGLSEDDISELIQHDLLMPNDTTKVNKVFPLHALVIANNARKLRDDFELDSHGMILALTLLQRIGELQNESKKMRAQFPFQLTAISQRSNEDNPLHGCG